MLVPFPLGRGVNFAPKKIPVGFKTQKTERSIQELLLNTKISGINGQKTLFSSFRSCAQTLYPLAYQAACSPAWIPWIPWRHGIQACDR